MKINDFFLIFERFFFDVIGNVIPGMAFILSFWILFDQPKLIGSMALLPPEDTVSWVVLIFISYVLGYVVSSIGETIIIRIIDKIVSILRQIKIINRLVPRTIQPENKLFESIRNSPNFQGLIRQVKQDYPWLISDTTNEMSFRTWRSIAITIAQENSNLVYRFMFISLLNLGTATVLMMVSILWGLNYLLLDRLGFKLSLIDFSLGVWLVLSLLSLFFIERRYSFYRRTMSVPFSMAVTKLGKDQSQSPTYDIMTSERIETVYLAGGFHTNWQDKVMEAVSGFKYLDPRSHNLQDRDAYTLWDLTAIRACDCMFAYLEESNPGGYALALEIGFAKALGKQILFVDEKSPQDEKNRRYLGMVRSTAHVVFDSFEEGIDYLKRLEEM